MPDRRGAAYDRQYLLDAGDKLRVVVYGQEGLTNSYAIDAGGSITMPLIGAVPARGLTPAGLASHITGRLRGGYIRETVGGGGNRSLPAVLHPRRGPPPPGNILMFPNMSVEERGRHCRRLLAARQSANAVTPHPIPTRAVRSARLVPLGTPLGPGDTILVGERWF